MSTRDALIEGGRTRVRPILMTAIATILALIPLAAGFNQGSIIAAELGTVVIGGLFSSTFLTLLVVPVDLLAGRRRARGDVARATGLRPAVAPEGAGATWPERRARSRPEPRADPHGRVVAVPRPWHDLAAHTTPHHRPGPPEGAAHGDHPLRRVVLDRRPASGSGTINYVSSGAFSRLPVTWASRTEDAQRQDRPEELLAAAHASCFSMAFAARLGKNGTPPPAARRACRDHVRPRATAAGQITKSTITVKVTAGHR